MPVKFGKTRWLALLLWTASGAFCLSAAYWLFSAAGRPELVLRLALIGDREQPRLAFRFTNYGSKEIVLDARELNFFLRLPETGSQKYLLQLQNLPGSGRGGDLLTLLPGGSADLGDAYPLLQGLGPGMLNTVFVSEVGDNGTDQPEIWRGVLHASPVRLGK